MSKVTNTDTTTDDMAVRKRAAEQTTTANKPRKRNKRNKKNKKNHKCTDVTLYNNLEKQLPTMLNVVVSHFDDKRNSDGHACVSRYAKQVCICSDMESLREFLRSLKDVGDVQANDMRKHLLDYLDNNEEEFYGDFDEYKGDLTASDMASELITLLYN